MWEENRLAYRRLSTRNREVLKYFKTGLSNKEIGELLFITENAVKFHLTAMYKIYGVRNQRQLLARFINDRELNTDAVETSG